MKNLANMFLQRLVDRRGPATLEASLGRNKRWGRELGAADALAVQMLESACGIGCGVP